MFLEERTAMFLPLPVVLTAALIEVSPLTFPLAIVMCPELVTALFMVTVVRESSPNVIDGVSVQGDKSMAEEIVMVLAIPLRFKSPHVPALAVNAALADQVSEAALNQRSVPLAPACNLAFNVSTLIVEGELLVMALNPPAPPEKLLSQRILLSAAELIVRTEGSHEEDAEIE
jgi:hypothetical protein